MTDDKKPSEKALQIAAQCWCDDNTSDRVMDIELALAFAKRLDNDYAAIAELTERNISLRESLKLAIKGLRHSISCEVIRELMIRKNKVFICECGMDKTLTKLKEHKDK